MAQQLDRLSLQQYLESRAFEEGREEAWDALDGGQNMRMRIKKDTYIDIARTFGLAPDRIGKSFEEGYEKGLRG